MKNSIRSFSKIFLISLGLTAATTLAVMAEPPGRPGMGGGPGGHGSGHGGPGGGGHGGGFGGGHGGPGGGFGGGGHIGGPRPGPGGGGFGGGGHIGGPRPGPGPGPMPGPGHIGPRPGPGGGGFGGGGHIGGPGHIGPRPGPGGGHIGGPGHIGPRPGPGGGHIGGPGPRPGPGYGHGPGPGHRPPYVSRPHRPFPGRFDHGRRFNRPGDYFRILPPNYFFQNWILYPGQSYADGYYVVDGYPYYAYNGYLNRYSDYDVCNFDLVDQYSQSTVQSFYGYSCRVGYDQCSSLRDQYNDYENAYRYYCAERIE